MFSYDALQQRIGRLDEMALEADATWGVDVLPGLVSDATREKWDRQLLKINEAVAASDIEALDILIDGTKRAYALLNAEARQRGHKPITPEYMEVRLESGFHLRIAKNNTQARCAMESGVYVWTLQEVARVIESEYTLLNKIKEVFPEAEVKKINPAPFDFKKGDSVPF